MGVTLPIQGRDWAANDKGQDLKPGLKMRAGAGLVSARRWGGARLGWVLRSSDPAPRLPFPEDPVTQHRAP